MDFVSMLAAHPGIAVAVSVALAGLLILVVWLIVRHRPTPEELEKRRRLMVNREGRTIEGEIAEADPKRLHYIYTVRGVTYSATQDVESLLEFLPCEPSRVIGEVSVKYLQINAANSIVVCEEWSGLPARRPSTLPDEAASSAAAAEEADGALPGAAPKVAISVGEVPATSPCTKTEI